MHAANAKRLRNCIHEAISHVYWATWEMNVPRGHPVPSMQILKLKLAARAWREYFYGAKTPTNSVFASMARSVKAKGSERARLIICEHTTCRGMPTVLHAAISVVSDQNAAPYRMRLTEVTCRVEDGIGMGILLPTDVGGNWLYCGDWSWIQELLTLGASSFVIRLGMEKLIWQKRGIGLQ